MSVFFVSRKKNHAYGGLSRFALELTSHFPKPYYLLSPDSPLLIFKLPFLKIDLIHLCDASLLPLGILLKFLVSKPLTLTAHGLDLTYSNPLYQLMLRMLLPKIDAVFLDSHGAKALLLPFNIPKHKIFIIPPGISINHFKSPNPPDFPNFPNLTNKLVLLTVGNLVSRKGHLWFIKNVFQKLANNSIYLIVGNGPERKEVEKLINQLNLTKRVLLLGKLTNSQLGYIYNLAGIYVAPNQKLAGDFEGFGIVCGEAAALGLPVVASRVDGIPRVIKDGKNGYLVEPEPRAFIKVIKKLKNPKLRKSLGLKAKSYTRKYYSWSETSQKYLTVFQQVIGKS